jgi:translation initiation factor 1
VPTLWPHPLAGSAERITAAAGRGRSRSRAFGPAWAGSLRSRMGGLFAGTDLEQPVTCAHCGRAGCVCPTNAAGEPCPPGLQSPRVRREKRRGKWNTIIAGVQAGPGATPGPGDLKPLLKTLRTGLGTGGGLSDGKAGPEIVLQGDHRDAVVERLVALGYRAKPSGG